MQKKLIQRRQRNAEAARSGGSEMDRAQQGFTGERTALPHRAEMEAGFGRSFGHVEAYTGASAQEASQSLGAEAYTVGNRVAFASESPSKEVVAHELAHTIQQSGGSAVQTYAAPSPDAMEKEADAAAATVVAGGKADIQMHAGGAVQRWGGADHASIGNLGGQKALEIFRALPEYRQGGMPKGVETEKTKVVRGGQAGPGGMKEQAGETLDVGVKRDVYDHTPDGMRYKSGEEDASMSLGEASRYSGDYAQTPEQLAQWANDKKGTASMIAAATSNSNHFYPLNRNEWAHHHAAALQAAEAGDMQKAMLEEGFAGHFLEDTFASGHMAPRSLDSIPHMKDDSGMGGDSYKGLARTKTWHDFFCMLPNGLPTDKGRFHGDNYMDGNDLERVSDAVGRSMAEVLSRANKGGYSGNVGGLIPTPDLGQILADPDAGPAWRLMQDGYRGDFNKAKSEIKDTDRGKTDGGTSFESKKDALDKIEQNVMGNGPASAAPVLGRAAQVTEKRKELLSSFNLIKHYLGASFNTQIYLQQDDELNAAAPGEARFNSMSRGVPPQDHLESMEQNFRLFSTAVTRSDEYLAALRSYEASAKGNAREMATAQIAIATKVAERVKSWKKRADEAGSGMFTRMSVRQKFTAQIREGIDSSVGEVGPLQELPAEEGAQPAPAQAAQAQ